jgi:formiminotetrahydrofolate cyclodeaminase
LSSGRDPLRLPLTELLDEVGSASPLPGGGAVAALTGALGASLVTMAARLSPDWKESRAAAAQALALRARLESLAGDISEAYDAVLRLRQEPGDARVERRDFALGQAYSRAVDPPLAIARSAADVATLAAEAAQRADQAYRADLGAAAALASGAARAAALLVAVNLAASEGDPRVSEAARLTEAAEQAARQALDTYA